MDKKHINQLFDVTMGSHELVGIPILSQLSRITKKTGLYRDDGLIIIKEPNDPKLNKIQEKNNKSIETTWIQNYHKTNLKITNFQDEKLNLEKGTFKPFKKENDSPIYILTSSNHLPSIIKQIPISISCRLSDNSSNINIFNNKKNIYNNKQKSRYTQLDTHHKNQTKK